MKNGFIYQTINLFLNSLKYFNLVELFKIVAQKLNPDSTNVDFRVMYSRVSTDIFIIFKWLFIITLLLFNLSNFLLTLLVWYLILSNLYTYFYYHIWSEKILTDKYYDINRIKRRFLNLFLSILYSVLCFSYLYYLPYSNEYYWINKKPDIYHSLVYSLSNSFTFNYDLVKPFTDLGYNISLLQLIMIFIFITIIISTSIPQIQTQNQEESNGL